jgi:hypothetical protein
MARGDRISHCLAFANDYSLTRPHGTYHINSDGYLIILNGHDFVHLQANHITGKDVDLDTPGLHRFLYLLAMNGVGVMQKYEEVEYEFLDA